MKALTARATRAIPVGSDVNACDNSGAKILKIFTVLNVKTTKGRRAQGGVGDLVMASVKRGRPDMRAQVVFAVIVRQKKEFRRPDGMWVKFEDNSAVVLKDDKGNPKGTILKGPVAKEAVDRWPGIAKIAKMVA